jgi:hypothetical protein
MNARRDRTMPGISDALSVEAYGGPGVRAPKTIAP